MASKCIGTLLFNSSIGTNYCCFYILWSRSSFSDFAQKYAKDERFKGVEKMRERESLFNEYLIDVRRREKEEKSQRRETVSALFDCIHHSHLVLPSSYLAFIMFIL